jgi:DNA-binding GntR family transcriptional regulator
MIVYDNFGCILRVCPSTPDKAFLGESTNAVGTKSQCFSGRLGAKIGALICSAPLSEQRVVLEANSTSGFGSLVVVEMLHKRINNLWNRAPRKILPVDLRCILCLSMVDRKSKTPGVVINQIRAAILDGLYKPGDRLLEADLAEKFHVSRSPVREALQALESEGTLVATPYAGAVVRPLSVAEACEIAEIRLGLISLALKSAHPHLAPAHFDLAYDLARRITRTKSAREAFECNRRFWDIIFENAERPILWEMFQKLDDRMTRYYPLVLKELYPTPESRPRQHEALIELYRKGRFAEASRAFKKIYLEIVDRIVEYLEAKESAKSLE